MLVSLNDRNVLRDLLRQITKKPKGGLLPGAILLENRKSISGGCFIVHFCTYLEFFKLFGGFYRVNE